jgi:GNAT superfamily N-acetyltransferase
MTEPAQLCPAPAPEGEAPVLVQARRPAAELGRFLYTAAGGNWYWTDRLGWTYQQWVQRMVETETWVAYLEGTPAGYFELDASVRGDVEIAYFGLLPAFIGRGLGGWLLTCAIERAWELRPERVWVHTCTLDGAAALRNYRARGMRICREETLPQQLPSEPPGPWPGATAPGPRARPVGVPDVGIAAQGE